MGVDGAQSGKSSEIEPEDAVEVAAQIELGLIAFGLLALPTDGSRYGLGGLGLEGGEMLFDLQVALAHLGLVVTVKRECLFESEEMFWAVVADEGFGDGGFGGFDTAVT